MYSLDIRTIMLMATLMSGAMSIVMFSAHHSFGQEVKGLGRWGMGLLSLVGAAIMFALRDVLPTEAALMSANALLLWGIGLSMIGTQEFFGQRPAWISFHLLWLTGVLGVGWFLLGDPNFSARVTVFSFVALGFYATQAVLVARHGVRHFSSFFFGGLITTQAVVVLCRGVMALLSGDVSADLLRGSALANLYLATANFMALMLAVAFMTMATRRLQTLLEERSTHDPLTGVLNRRGFASFYERLRAQSRRDARPMALLEIDLDHFKSINDRFGHAVGDCVLTHIAHTVGTALREGDYVARFGGEEFVVLLPNTDAPNAHLVAERVQHALRAQSGRGLPECTVSIGVACHVSELETLDSLLSRADAALYRAKAEGRDRIELADAPEVRLTAVLPVFAAGTGNPY